MLLIYSAHGAGQRVPWGQQDSLYPLYLALSTLPVLLLPF